MCEAVFRTNSSGALPALANTGWARADSHFSCKSAIGTIVERKSRYTLIIKLKSKKAMEVVKMFSKILNRLNPIRKKSMTYNNGIEMARHQ